MSEAPGPADSGAPTRPTHLAAIVFTDIAGYSRLMEEDEERTIRLLKEHNAIVLPLIERFGGEVWREQDRELERRLLQLAREAGGTLTVVQAASSIDLPLDEVQNALDAMTAKGYVTQHVRDSGVIEYEFPSLVRSDV